MGTAVKAEMSKFGRKLVDNGLTTSFFGNISAYENGILYATKTGSMLDELEEDNIVEVFLDKACPNDSFATTELCVHRKIISATGAKRVMHAHTVFSILAGDFFKEAACFSAAEILPFLKYVPVVTGKSGTEELAENVAEGLSMNKIVIVKDHGVFAVGDTLKECYVYISGLEFYSKALLMKKLFTKNGIIGII
ncbi:MAG: class II aldolase/adducin family protein [Deferribacterales bacterium]